MPPGSDEMAAPAPAPAAAHDLTDKRDRTADVLCDAVVSFADMQLRDSTTRGLHAAGFRTCSPIQARAIPLARSGLDLLVQAKSGTGKTLVFVVAILEATNAKLQTPQSLVLAPTREIAIQIEQNLRQCGQALAGFRAESFIGGLDVQDDRRKMQQCHCVVGTPGRLLHLLKNNILNCAQIGLFVLDEADQLMASDSFRKDVRAIVQRLSKRTQTLALSATFEQGVDSQLARLMHRQPIGVTPRREVPILLGVKQFVHTLPAQAAKMNTMQEMYAKVKAVNEIFERVPFSQCLIFLNSNQRAESYSNYLSQSGYPTDVIMGRMDQSQRLHTFKRFRSFESRILVCTDLMARGVDSENVNLVINLDVPINSTCYLHRIGRAGRFGTRGMSVTLLCDADDERRFGELLGSLGGREMSVLRFPIAAGADEDVWEWDTTDMRERCFGVEVVGSRRAEEQAMQAIRQKTKEDKKRMAEWAKEPESSESEQASPKHSPSNRRSLDASTSSTAADDTTDDHIMATLSSVEASPQPTKMMPANDWDALINKFSSNTGCAMSPKSTATTIVEQNQLLLSAAASMIDAVRPTAGDHLLPVDLFGPSSVRMEAESNQEELESGETVAEENLIAESNGLVAAVEEPSCPMQTKSDEPTAPVPDQFGSLLSKLSDAHRDSDEPAADELTSVLSQMPAELPVESALSNKIDVSTTETAATVAPVSDLFDNLLAQLCGATKGLNPNMPSFSMPEYQPTELPVDLFGPSAVAPTAIEVVAAPEAAIELTQAEAKDPTGVSFAPSNDQHFDRLLSQLCGGGKKRTRLEPIPEATSCAKLIDATTEGLQMAELPIDLFGSTKLSTAPAAPMEIEGIEESMASQSSSPDSIVPTSDQMDYAEEQIENTSHAKQLDVTDVQMTSNGPLVPSATPPLHVVLNLPFNNEFHNPPDDEQQPLEPAANPTVVVHNCSFGGQQPSRIPGIMWQPVAAKQRPAAILPTPMPIENTTDVVDLLADAVEVVKFVPPERTTDGQLNASDGGNTSSDDSSEESYGGLDALTVVRAKLRWRATFQRQMTQIQDFIGYTRNFNGFE